MRGPILMVLCVLVVACPPNPAPVPPDATDGAPAPAPPNPPSSVDASDGTPCGKACANLAAIGCSDGKAPSCVATCQHNAGSPVSATINVAKMQTAKTMAEARAAGARCD